MTTTTTTTAPTVGAQAVRERTGHRMSRPIDRPATDPQSATDRAHSPRPGPEARSNARPALSTTIEREHVVFTASSVLDRDHLTPVAASDRDTTVEIVDPVDDLLLDQPRHVADRLPCRVQDPDLWFAETPVELEQAKVFCVDCPARRACLAGAISRREPWGVWGGEIFDHGVVIARKRPRGRPRKDEVAA